MEDSSLSTNRCINPIIHTHLALTFDARLRRDASGPQRVLPFDSAAHNRHVWIVRWLGILWAEFHLLATYSVW